MKSEPVTDRNPTPGLTGDGAGEQRLAGARRADEEHALGHTGADLAEAVGHPQEVDDLGDLLLDAFVAGDVGERRRRAVLAVGLGAAAPDRHHVAHLPGGAALHPDEEADDQQHGQQQPGDAQEPVAARRLELVVDVGLAQRLLVLLGQAALTATGGA